MLLRHGQAKRDDEAIARHRQEPPAIALRALLSEMVQGLHQAV